MSSGKLVSVHWRRGVGIIVLLLCAWPYQGGGLLQVPSLEKVLEFKAHEGEIEDLALGPDGKVRWIVRRGWRKE